MMYLVRLILSDYNNSFHHYHHHHHHDHHHHNHHHCSRRHIYHKSIVAIIIFHCYCFRTFVVYLFLNWWCCQIIIFLNQIMRLGSVNYKTVSADNELSLFLPSHSINQQDSSPGTALPSSWWHFVICCIGSLIISDAVCDNNFFNMTMFGFRVESWFSDTTSSGINTHWNNNANGLPWHFNHMSSLDWHISNHGNICF